MYFHVGNIPHSTLFDLLPSHVRFLFVCYLLIINSSVVVVGNVEMWKVLAETVAKDKRAKRRCGSCVCGSGRYVESYQQGG